MHCIQTSYYNYSYQWTATVATVTNSCKSQIRFIYRHNSILPSPHPPHTQVIVQACSKDSSNKLHKPVSGTRSPIAACVFYEGSWLWYPPDMQQWSRLTTDSCKHSDKISSSKSLRLTVWSSCSSGSLHRRQWWVHLLLISQHVDLEGKIAMGRAQSNKCPNSHVLWASYSFSKCLCSRPYKAHFRSNPN